MPRRERLRRFACSTVLLCAALVWGAGPSRASQLQPQTPLPGKVIPKYVEPLPTFGPQGTPRVEGSRAVAVDMVETAQKVLPAQMYSLLPVPYSAGTWLWAYDVGGTGPLYPGATIESQRGIPTTVTYTNALPAAADGGIVQTLLSVDQTIHWADPLQGDCIMNPLGPACIDANGNPIPYTGPVPAVAHLHGAEVPSSFDGTPEQWFTPNGLTGPAYRSYDPAAPDAASATAPAPGQARYYYPNGQEPTTLWFHDHALGMTRLNVYSGLAAFYLLRDERDTGRADNPIRLPAADYEVELMIQDRQFDTNGQWYFPDGSGPGLNGMPPNPALHPFWIPEFLGDVIVVNGKTWPYLEVEPRRYRFRILNASNARFYDLSIPNGPAFWQIGTDGGLLDAPAKLTHLLLGPAERADVIVDFAGFRGKTFTVRNSARTPFPKGPPPDPQTNGQILQFRVVKPLAGTDGSCSPAAGTCSLRAAPLARLAAGGAPDVRRQLTLNEEEGPGGPAMLMLNNTRWNGQKLGMGTPVGSQALALYGTGMHQTFATEQPRVGSTELWELVNVSADTHPIHVHLIQFQLLSRQAFNVSNYVGAYAAAFPGGAYVPEFGPPLDYFAPNADGALGGNPAVTPFLQDSAKAPLPNERGWKDTILAYPGQVTRIAVRFAPQDVPVGASSPGTNYFANRTSYPASAFDATRGPGYVWHCHILDHEDNEMMRPYVLLP